jgi:hypothetical protein
MAPPELPAKCTSCGSIVRSGIFVEGVARDVQARGNTARCHCGGVARTFEGTFNADSRGIEVLEGSAESVALLREAGLLIEKLLDEGLEPEAIAERVAEVAPELARRLPKTKAALATVAAGLVLAVGAPIATRAGEAVRDHIFGTRPTATGTQFQPPEGSEGEITYRDGMTIRWAPGTRPINRKP